ncbi:glycosyltransferase family 87 protein [Tengunoibacter tsumagoiensis]|uniref:DUF2029 domain-containing protein n=1 Tax=Tengunoibacter tsumagoiensis TaxID=2014871 RepID=A0A402A1K0_9CHLR|nr:glycosyltransferase family 87 protein [Tengunoibacter tsumagoiensis]GCE13013.1 hypothetical protein KTT_28720 [Tengunoibacter tsumagoiensis]
MDSLLVIILLALLFTGISNQLAKVNSDAAKYQCYAFAFWHGTQALHTLPEAQCAFLKQAEPAAILLENMRQHQLPDFLIQFVAQQDQRQPFHALPHEYPLLALATFLPGLLAPPSSFQLAFAGWMACIVVALFVIMRIAGSRSTALAFAFYLGLGSWATALGRFDLLPTTFTLLAVIWAEKKRWHWSFICLAIATLLKFYPALFLLPFLIVQQQNREMMWLDWRRWSPVGLFILICSFVLLLSAAMSLEGTIAPLSYFANRPLQVESFSASLVRILGEAGGTTLQYGYSYGSRNVFSPLSPLIAGGATLLLCAGIVYTCWHLWHQRISLAMAVLLLLLLLLLTGKVFSAQYILWSTPLVAYVGGWRWRWLSGWGSICLLTTLIYPFLYNRTEYSVGSLLPDFYLVVLVRNLILLGFTCLLYYQATHQQTEV